MDNLISRQAAIEHIDAIFPVHPEASEYAKGIACGAALAKIYIKQLPSAEPEQKKGKWIERNPQNSERCRLIECNQCGYSHIVGFNVSYEDWIKNRNFCQECGADMRGIEDAEIH